MLQGLVDKGNTVIVIEHNLDVIKSADWIVDLGPEGGKRGGLVIAEGTPEDVAANADSFTGQFLAPILEKARAGMPAARPSVSGGTGRARRAVATTGAARKTTTTKATTTKDATTNAAPPKATPAKATTKAAPARSTAQKAAPKQRSA